MWHWGTPMRRNDLRNVAIVAHVDHGKTTLVDALLRQTGTVSAHVRMPERAMDRLDQERERGITILAKNTAVRHGDVTINIVDTPGHADFGGEVERIMSSVDTVLLLVDACEGAMPQTRFVLRKALARGLDPIVVINKIDRGDARPAAVVDEVFDLFVALEASEEQLDFAIVYSSARDGWATLDPDVPSTDMGPLLDVVVERARPPEVEPEGPFRLQPATVDYDEYVGRIAIGCVNRGSVRKGDPLVCIGADGRARPGKVTRLVGYVGLGEVDVAVAKAGEVVGLAGMLDVLPGETLCDPDHPDPLPPIAVDEPTVTIEMLVNDGPFVGRDGNKVTSRNLRERLAKEVQSNVALRVEDTDQSDVFRVSGRGELHLCVLLETMRREGYEMTVSTPRVVVREGTDGKQEPYEDAAVECAEGHSGAVIKELNGRGGELRDLHPAGEGMVRIGYRVPSRALIGYSSLFMTQTRGTGTLSHTFCGWGPWRGPFDRRAFGSLISLGTGRVTAHALETLQERGTLFVEPGDEVYAGQVVGENSRAKDMPVNPTRARKLDNIRSSTKELTVKLDVPRKHTLESALEFINPDELVEVTPSGIRVRKRVLDERHRKRIERGKAPLP